jgi:hypothetical protein
MSNKFLGVVLHVFISFSPMYLMSEEEGCVDQSDFLLFMWGVTGDVIQNLEQVGKNLAR